ncbi:transposase [Pseudomonas purpurea]|uniref:transposase n=1 Tax=Pseudomonas purpurea TaxID=3136737 RepID=UPI0032672844
MQLDTFVKRLQHYDLAHDTALIIDDLRHLAKNRTLLSDHLLKHLKQTGFNTRSFLYNAYAFVLHHNPSFSIRLGFWLPVSSRDESATFIYHLNHTHDFEIYSVGYSGDGYRSVGRMILQDEPLQAGVRPKLGSVREIRLAPGEVLHMQPFNEVHRQLPPERLSASLSLVIHAQLLESQHQAWCFDEHYIPTFAGIGTQEVALYEQALHLLEHG